MKSSKSADVLADPEIQRHTERILVLREEERQTRAKLGEIIAAIGAELIAVKKALDKTPEKTAWQRWLKDHVPYSADTAQRYMRVARFSQKNRKRLRFFRPGSQCSVSPRRVARRGGRHSHTRYPADRPADRAARASEGYEHPLVGSGAGRAGGQAGPGPHDPAYLFARFRDLIKSA